MPIPYSEIRQLVDDGSFQRRLQVALWREASVQLRKSPAPAQAIVDWSKAQLRGPTQNMIEATIRVATGGATNDSDSVYNKGADVTDDDLQRIVGIVLADLAGA